MDVHKISINLIVNFSNVFDTFVHCTLLGIIKHYGIGDIVHKFFKSYLEYRKQRVLFNEKSSDNNNDVIQSNIPRPPLVLIQLYSCHTKCK